MPFIAISKNIQEGISKRSKDNARHFNLQVDEVTPMVPAMQIDERSESEEQTHKFNLLTRKAQSTGYLRTSISDPKLWTKLKDSGVCPTVNK